MLDLQLMLPIKKKKKPSARFGSTYTKKKKKPGEYL